MKKKLNLPELILPALLILATFNSNAQVNTPGTHTLTTANANIIASRSKLDLTDLNGKPDAIIIATPVGATKTNNPHPNGAWYYADKWNFFNSDHFTLVPGLVYDITYYVNPGTDQFLHAVTQQNLVNGHSYITHGKLDNNPNAQFAFFQNHSPILRPGSVLNQFEAKIGYDSTVKKWYITNWNSSTPLLRGAYYNIVVSPGPTVVTTIAPTILNGAVVNTTPTTTVPLTVVPATTTLVNGVVTPINNSSTQPCNCPTSLPPNGQATGDLIGMYPNPMVQKILGRFLSNTPPAIGQTLKWNGNEWAPSDDIGASTSSTMGADPMKTYFKNGSSSISAVPPGGILPLTELTTTVPLDKLSRLVISAMIDIIGDNCLTCNTASHGKLHVIIDGSSKLFLDVEVPAHSILSSTISNFMISLSPGPHTIAFEVKHSQLTSKLRVTARYSSIMVIPLE